MISKKAGEGLMPPKLKGKLKGKKAPAPAAPPGVPAPVPKPPPLKAGSSKKLKGMS